MEESDTDLAELQRSLDRSAESGGAHLRSIFDDDHRISAPELVAALDGIFEMHLATVTSDGSPLVAPLDGILFKGKVWFGLPRRSVRARLVRKDPWVSASYVSGSFAFIVHGKAREAVPTSPLSREFEAVQERLYVDRYGSGWVKWRREQRRDDPEGLEFNGYIEPRVMIAKR